MSTLGVNYQNFRNNTKGTEPPHTTPNDWSEFKAISTVDLDNNNLVNASSITANQFIGAVDLTGDLLIEGDLYLNKDISGGTRITTALNNAYYQNFNNGQMVFSPYFSTDEILTIDPSNNFVRVKNEAYLGNKSQTTEQQPLRVINATGSRSNNNNPVSIGLYNAISNFVGNEENAKILLRDENGANNTADAVLETWLRTDPNADGTSSYLMKGYTITANRGELNHTIDTNLTISDLCTINGSLKLGSDLEITPKNLNTDTATTKSGLTLGTDQLINRWASPFYNNYTGPTTINFGSTCTSRSFDFNTNTTLNLYIPNPPSSAVSSVPVEHTILCRNLGIIDRDILIRVVNSTGTVQTGNQVCVKDGASSLVLGADYTATFTPNQVKYIYIKAVSDVVNVSRYYINIESS